MRSAGSLGRQKMNELRLSQQHTFPPRDSLANCKNCPHRTLLQARLNYRLKMVQALETGADGIMRGVPGTSTGARQVVAGIADAAGSNAGAGVGDCVSPHRPIFMGDCKKKTQTIWENTKLAQMANVQRKA